MTTPVSWLERVPTYKEQQDALSDKDLSSIGFLSYPLLQTADVAIYDAQSSFLSATIRSRTSSWRARWCGGSIVSTAMCSSSRSRC